MPGAPEPVTLAPQPREALVARITNYEEAMAEVIQNLKGVPEAEASVTLLQTLMDASGQEHLDAIRGFELQVSAVLAFKNHVLSTLSSPVCRVCGAEGGAHSPACLVGSALGAQPTHLPSPPPTAANFVGLHTRLQGLLQTGAPISPEDLRQALQQFPAEP